MAARAASQPRAPGTVLASHQRNRSPFSGLNALGTTGAFASPATLTDSDCPPLQPTRKIADDALQEAYEAAQAAVSAARSALKDDWGRKAVNKRLAASGRLDAYDQQAIIEAHSTVFAAAARWITALREAEQALTSELSQGSQWSTK
jgi:hypothetical protein